MKQIYFFILLLSLIPLQVFAKKNFTRERLYQLSGEKKGHTSARMEWDQAYARSTFIFGKSPVKFLAENYDYIPKKSEVLDMGMGEGRNAVFLAKKGHKVTGIDISSVAIKKSYLLAKEHNVKIKGIVASLDKYRIQEKSFDAIICFYYIDRSLIAKMKSWLRPGGVLVFEAFTEKQKTVKGHRAFKENQYLKDQELLSMFGDMKILKYEEPDHEKNYRASIIVKREL